MSAVRVFHSVDLRQHQGILTQPRATTLHSQMVQGLRICFLECCNSSRSSTLWWQQNPYLRGPDPLRVSLGLSEQECLRDHNARKDLGAIAVERIIMRLKVLSQVRTRTIKLLLESPNIIAEDKPPSQ